MRQHWQPRFCLSVSGFGLVADKAHIRAAHSVLQAMTDNLADEDIAEALDWEGIDNPEDEDYVAVRGLLYDAGIG